jgi:hypothetical protein
MWRLHKLLVRAATKEAAHAGQRPDLRRSKPCVAVGPGPGETKDLPAAAAAAAARERAYFAVDRLDAPPIVQTGGRLRSTRLPASTGSRRGRSEKTQSSTVRPLLVDGLYIELTDVLSSLPPLTDARLADTRDRAELVIADGQGAGT